MSAARDTPLALVDLAARHCLVSAGRVHRGVCQRRVPGRQESSAIQVVVRSPDGPATEGAGAEILAEAITMLRGDADRRDRPAQPGATLGQDGSTAILLAGAGAGAVSNDMVRAGLPPDQADRRRDVGDRVTVTEVDTFYEEGRPRALGYGSLGVAATEKRCGEGVRVSR